MTEKARLVVQLIGNIPEGSVQKGKSRKSWKKPAVVVAIACVILISIFLYFYNFENPATQKVAIPYNGVLMDITGSGSQDWASIPHNYYVQINFNNTGFLYNAQIRVHYLAVNGSWMDVSTLIPEPASRGGGGSVATSNCQYVPGTKFATPLYFTPTDNLTTIKVEVFGYKNPQN